MLCHISGSVKEKGGTSSTTVKHISGIVTARQLSKMWPQLVLLFITSQAHGQQCSWGIYGENCDKNCPLTCNTDPVKNLRHCQKYTGKCSEGCVPGHHGDQCNILCSGGCLHKTCNQGNGQCTIGCSGTYSGDYCNITSASQAHGGQQCSWGIYGENCDKNCPLTCNSDPVRNLRHCQKYTGMCSEGCVPGHHGDLCDILCSGGCLHKTCNQGNGQCTIGCSGTYRGDYCNITSGMVVVECFILIK
ncbi:multiple epidermal growth factor-like domains protein 10 [Haliotis rufescens]|uniref:multiple epidermal growth factor-like domains protein 10 n=1 Tax=Haliotis rufescens TaxID=6454 RepID=UPI00201F9C2B|nr:multiple epidermal growth factor-like domains protein 10 [Haliotis rufescens]